MSTEKDFLNAVNDVPFLPDELQLELAAKEYLNGKRMPVIKCGWDSWLNNFGLLWNQITGIGGYANYGKGTLARQLMMQASKHESVNCGLWCPEDMPIEYAYMDLVSTYTGLNTEHPEKFEYIGEKRGMEAFNEMRERFFIVDSMKWQENSLDKILEAFERLYMENNCRLFLIDPYKDVDQDSMVRDDFRVHEDIMKMRRFVQKYKVHLFIVLHLKRPTTKSGEDPPTPTYNDLHYGSEWSKSLDNMMFYHHPTFFSDRKNVNRTVAISKCKKRKIQGNADQFQMEWRYYENRIVDENGKCDLPQKMPNVQTEYDGRGFPQGAKDRAKEKAEESFEPTDNLPF